jgi:hypothetical protein
VTKRIFISFVIFFGLLQFFRPEKNTGDEIDQTYDLMTQYRPPASVQAMLENACYDCHSNQTRYPWYAKFQPTAWWLDRHVREGKSMLNFSTFGKLPPKKARKALESMIDELNENRMPLKSYLWIHSDARLSQAQVEELITWTDQVIKEIK